MVALRRTAYPQYRPIFYVYTLANPYGEVFYVGKGTKARMYMHEDEAARGGKSKKCDIIREIWASGGQVQKDIVYQTTIEHDALVYEWILVNMIFDSDTLTNIKLAPLLFPPEPEKEQIDWSRIDLSRSVPSTKHGYSVGTLEEVAEILRVSVQTVRRLIDDGELKAFKVRGQWRIRKEDLDDYINQQFNPGS